jgi:hypothetical protein
MVDLKLSKDQLVQFNYCPAEEFLWLTNAYVELAIIIVLACPAGATRTSGDVCFRVAVGGIADFGGQKFLCARTCSKTVFWFRYS